MGAIILAADGARPRAPRTPEPGFVVLRAPDAEPPARPLVRVRAARAAPPLPAPSEPAPPEPIALPGPVAAVHPDAHRFVLSTLRPVFEVLDRRRPAKHLSAIASGTVVDVLRALAATGPGPGGTISGWGDVHVGTPRTLARRARRERGPEVGSEIFLTYTRGERVLAAAGRVEATAGQWQWVAFTTAA